MAEEKQIGFEVPEQMREGAQRSLEQARKALDTVLGTARRATENMEQSADMARVTAKDMAQKTFSSAEDNIHAALDLAERLVQAKDPQEATQIQAEYVRSQFEAVQAQMRKFGERMQSTLSQVSPGRTDTGPTSGTEAPKSKGTRK